MGESGARARKREMAEMKTLEGQPYFHGLLPNKQAGKVLLDEGDFLLRYQDNDRTRSHGFVICLLHKSNYLSLKVLYSSEDRTYYLNEQAKERSVKRLVESHYKKGKVINQDEERLVLKTPVPRSRWELNAKDVLMGTRVGRGAFADVYKGIYKGGAEAAAHPTTAAGRGRPSLTVWSSHSSTTVSQTQDTPPRLRRRTVAVKQCRETTISALVRFEKESHFQLQLRHPNVVETVGIVTSPPRRMIVLEFMAKGALDQFLRSQDGKAWGTMELEKACLHGVKGLAYLHGLGIIHRDVAARNCLVSAEGVVKIADFGLAKSMTVYKMTRGRIPVKWLAPESIRSGNFTAKSDVWAFGILCWEVFSKGKDPYPGMNNAEVKTKVAREKYHMGPPANASPAIADAILSCWKHEPDDRPSFKDLKHIITRAISSSSNILPSTVRSGPSLPSI